MACTGAGFSAAVVLPVRSILFAFIAAVMPGQTCADQCQSDVNARRAADAVGRCDADNADAALVTVGFSAINRNEAVGGEPDQRFCRAAAEGLAAFRRINAGETDFV